MSFDAWGARRNPALANDVWNQWDLNDHSTWPSWVHAMHDITPRGYTGHEDLDEFGLIHMNGRIYDPTLGRFLQADPFMEDTGTLNRYTYVHNNPLIYTDPSGYLSWREGAAIAISFLAVATQQYWAIYVNKGLGLAAVGYTSGYLSTGTGRGALAGAFSAVAFYQIGQHFPASAGDAGVLGTSYTSPELVRASIAHGVVGGVGSSIQGGRFGHGFAAAGFGKLATRWP